MRNLVLGGVLALAACGPYLRWTPAPPARSLAGKVAIVVEDQREPKQGGDDRRAIGLETGGFGIPDTIRLPSRDDAAGALRGLVAAAALAAGVGVSPPGDSAATAKVGVAIEKLWCSGDSRGYRAELRARVTIVDPATNAVRVAAMALSADGRASRCRDAYRGALSQASVAAQALFAQAQVQVAATGAGDPPAAPAPPAE